MLRVLQIHSRFFVLCAIWTRNEVRTEPKNSSPNNVSTCSTVSEIKITRSVAPLAPLVEIEAAMRYLNDETDSPVMSRRLRGTVGATGCDKQSNSAWRQKQRVRLRSMTSKCRWPRKQRVVRTCRSNRNEVPLKCIGCSSSHREPYERTRRPDPPSHNLCGAGAALRVGVPSSPWGRHDRERAAQRAATEIY